MSLWRSLQDSPFTDWLLGSESIWTYPFVLTLHTAGLAILVGASVVILLRLLGVGRAIPLAWFRQLYPAVWTGLAINLSTGLMLFVTQAADLVSDPVFYVKIGSIALALWIDVACRRWLVDDPPGAGAPGVGARGPAARTLAMSGLALWTTAIVAGRLMAYY